MSKRNSSDSLLTIDQVMNHINTWFFDKDCDRDEVEDDSDDLCGEQDEKNENNRDPTEQFITEDEVIENIDDGERK